MSLGVLYDDRGGVAAQFEMSAGGGSHSHYDNHSRMRRQEAGRRSRPVDEDSLVSERDLGMQRLEAIQLARTNPIVEAALPRISDNVVGPNGLMPQAKTTDKAWNDESEAFFGDWTADCDHRERIDFREMQKLTVDARFLSGDCGFVLTEMGQLQPIEAERVATPRAFKGRKGLAHGVQFDSSGRTVDFHICRRDDKGRVDLDKFDTVAAENFILVHNPKMRFDRFRSSPDLWAIVAKLVDFYEMSQSTLGRAKMDAATGRVVTREAGVPSGAIQGRGAGGDQVPYESFNPNSTYYLNPGEKMESFASNTPNPQFVGFCEQELRIISAALHVPYEFLLMDYRNGSYSSGRSALLQTQRTFEMWQTWMITRFLKRVWNWRISMAMREGDLPLAPVDERGVSEWHKVEWSRPASEWIDPKQETASDREGFKMGKTSLTQVLRKRGTTTDKVLHEKGDDMIIAINESKRIEAETGVVVPWEKLIDVGLPGDPSTIVQGKATGGDDE